MDAEEIIKKLDMRPLPQEGGYYKETYRSSEVIDQDCLPDRYEGSRNVSTAILYLITPKNFSRLHRIKSDEVFHFYMGDPLYMLNLFQDGTVQEPVLGADIAAGQRIQHIVPRGTWQGACLKQGGRFALLGTTVSPGFDFSDYEDCSGHVDRLLQIYPAKKQAIQRLT